MLSPRHLVFAKLMCNLAQGLPKLCRWSAGRWRVLRRQILAEEVWLGLQSELWGENIFDPIIDGSIQFLPVSDSKDNWLSNEILRVESVIIRNRLPG